MRKHISARDMRCEVWIDSNTGRLHKSQPKYMTDNEFYFLSRMANSGYVPANVVLEGIEEVSMEFIRTELVMDAGEFMSHYEKVLLALRDAGIRHGDLTEYSVLVRNNRPILIDFAESRTWDSPLPDKRREGDLYWLDRTMRMLADVD